MKKKDPLRPVYLVSKEPLPKHHFVHEFVKPGTASAFGTYDEIRGNMTLHHDVQIFEHLRCGLTDYCPTLMWWGSDNSLNPSLAYINPNPPWLNALNLSLFSSTDDVPKDSETDSWLGNWWSYDDWYYGPITAMDLSGNTSVTTIPDYRENGRTGTYDFNYFQHFHQARIEVEDTLKSMCLSDAFDTIVDNASHIFAPLLSSSHGGTFLDGLSVTVSAPNMEDRVAAASETTSSGKTLAECISKALLHDHLDTNFGIYSDNEKMYNRFDKSDGNAMVVLGEIPEIFKLAADIIRFGVTLVSPSKWPRSFAKLRRAIGSTWLGYNFGVAPTVGDIKKLLEDLVQAEEKAFTIPVVSQLRYDTTPVPMQPLAETLSPRWGELRSPVVNGAILAPFAGQFSDTDEYGTYVWYEDITAYYTRPLVYQRQKIYVSTENYKKYLKQTAYPENLSLSISDILRDWSLYTDGTRSFASLVSAVWELLPFSWLIDYFINIQDFIRFIDRADEPLLQYVEGSSVRFVGVEFGVAHARLDPLYRYEKRIIPDSEVYFAIAHFGAREFRRQRECTVKYTMPDLELGLPNIKQMLNIGALLISMN